MYPNEVEVRQIAKEVVDESGSGGSADWNTLSNKPAVIGAGATAADARTAIGAGTSNLVIGTTGTTAKAGNYIPTYAEITGKPTNFPPTIGTTSTTAMAGNTVIPSIVGLISNATDTFGAKVTNIVSCSQAEYDGLTPDANTFYIIV